MANVQVAGRFWRESDDDLSHLGSRQVDELSFLLAVADTWVRGRFSLLGLRSLEFGLLGQGFQRRLHRRLCTDQVVPALNVTWEPGLLQVVVLGEELVENCQISNGQLVGHQVCDWSQTLVEVLDGCLNVGIVVETVRQPVVNLGSLDWRLAIELIRRSLACQGTKQIVVSDTRQRVVGKLN